eukprot:m.13946 g.13946  ORF g.13946 m.13946 type:complete len:499 (+) comp3334_c0_seq1:56-1552(+)
MAEQIRAWLAEMKLERYTEAFITNGYDDPACLESLDEGDLDALGITLPGHRKRLLLNASRYGTVGGAGGPPAGSPPAVPSDVPPSRAPPPIPTSTAPNDAPPPRPAPSAAPDDAPPARPPARPPREPAPSSAPPSLPPARPPKEGGQPPPVPAKAALSRSGSHEAPTFTSTPSPPKPAPRPMSMFMGGAAPPTLPAMGAPPPKPKPKPAGTPTSPAAAVGGEVPTSLRSIPVEIQNEATGVLTQISVTRNTTAQRALELYSAAGREKRDTSAIWRLFEVFETPPVERWLADTESVIAAKENWPKGAVGCRFVVRELPLAQAGRSMLHMSGKLDKRGGSHKNWKSRYFVLDPNAGLMYYSSEKSCSKNEAAIGTWPINDHVVFYVRNLKKAPRPDMCFCVRQKQDPMWPDDVRDINDAFENGCKFMCAADAVERATWVASIMGAQPKPPVVEDPPPSPPKAAEPVAEEKPFVPIGGKPVMGVGFGNVHMPIKPKRTSDG